MELVSKEDVKRLWLHYGDLTVEELAAGRATVAGLPPLSRQQWERIARRLGLVVTGDGGKPIGTEGPAGLSDPNSAEGIP